MSGSSPRSGRSGVSVCESAGAVNEAAPRGMRTTRRWGRHWSRGASFAAQPDYFTEGPALTSEQRASGESSQAAGMPALSEGHDPLSGRCLLRGASRGRHESASARLPKQFTIAAVNVLRAARSA
jgi:hypothetical protein